MALYPHVQERAQAELDRVVGPNRLPEFEDLPQLPYIRAVVAEITRWMPVGPLGIPHKSTADDIYNGYHIPAGSMFIVVGHGEMFVSQLRPTDFDSSQNVRSVIQ